MSMVPAMVGMLFPENSVVAMALYTFSFVSVLNLKKHMQKVSNLKCVTQRPPYALIYC